MSLDRNLQEVASQDVATTAETHGLVTAGVDAGGLVRQVLTDSTGKVEVTTGAANLPVIDASVGALNASGPLFSTQIGGQDGTGKLQTCKVDASGNLNINLAAGSISGGNAAAAPTGAAVPASADYLGVSVAGTLTGVTGLSLTNAKPMTVAMVDGAGTQITSFGGGVQFADNAASGATPTGSLSMGWDSALSKVRALKVDASQNLEVAIATALPAGTAVIGHVINDASSAVIGHVIADSGSTTAVTGNVTVIQGTGTNLHVVVDTAPTTAVTGTFFQATQPVSIAATVTVAEAAATTGGCSIQHLVSAGSTNSTSVKASAGQVYSWSVYNAAAYPVYLKLYNKATAPTVGTDTPVVTIGVQAGTARDGTVPPGAVFATGIGLAITKGIADLDNTAVLVSDCVIDLFYH